MNALAQFPAAWWDLASAQTAQVALIFALFWCFDAVLARLGASRCRAALVWAFFVKLFVSPNLASPIGLAQLARVDGPIASQPRVFPVAGTAIFIAYVVGVVGASLLTLRCARAERCAWLDAGLVVAPRRVAELAAGLARELGMRRAPVIRVGRAAPGPAVVGLFRPIIVLPERIVHSAPRVQLRHVLLHELAHVKRRDPRANAVWTLATCIYWFHPCVWLAARRAALLREIGCDELAALRALEGARGYRRTLLEMARPLVRDVALSSGFARGEILARLAVLERPLGRSPRTARLGAGAVFAFACLCCVPLGRATAVPRQAPELSDLGGCLRRHYLVLGELAKEDAASSTALSR